MGARTTTWTDVTETFSVIFNCDDTIVASGGTFSISEYWQAKLTSSYYKEAKKFTIVPALVVNNTYTRNVSSGIHKAATPQVAHGVYGTAPTTLSSHNTSTYFNSSNKNDISVPFYFELNRDRGYDGTGNYGAFVAAESSVSDIASLSTKTLFSGRVQLNAPPSCAYTQVSDISDRPVWTQGMSVARVTISDAAAQYGGDIANVKLIIGTNSASISGNGNIDVPILDSGTLTPQIVVTDSRGQTTSYTLNPIMVMAYQKPSIESIEFERHVPLGEQDETQVYINATIKQTHISGNSMGVPEVLVDGNDISEEIVWYNEPTHETVYNSTTAASKNIYGIVDDSEVFATGSTYNFTLSISDAFSTSESKIEVLPTIFITMDFQAGGKEIAFGAKADDNLLNYPRGLFKCSMDMILRGNRVPTIFISTSDPTSADGADGDIWIKYSV